jgi:hypothetical protein
MANEKDLPPSPALPPPVEGATKQFTLKMSSWLTALASDLDAPAGAPPAFPEAPLDQLLEPEKAKPSEEAEPEPEELSLEDALFASEYPPKP